jgi:hypothetical protein
MLWEVPKLSTGLCWKIVYQWHLHCVLSAVLPVQQKSNEDFILLGYDAAWIHNQITLLGGNVVSSSSMFNRLMWLDQFQYQNKFLLHMYRHKYLFKLCSNITKLHAPTIFVLHCWCNKTEESRHFCYFCMICCSVAFWFGSVLKLTVNKKILLEKKYTLQVLLFREV